MAGEALTLRFGTDFAGAQRSLGELAATVGSNMGNIAKAATGAGAAFKSLQAEGSVNMLALARAATAASATLRRDVTGGAGEATAAIVKYAATWNNAKIASTLSIEAIKVAFAMHNPVLAVAAQMLGTYKYALGGVAAGALTVYEAIKMVTAEMAKVNTVIAGAEKAGVSATLFQVWINQADKARLSIEQMETALQTAAKAVRPTFDNAGNQQISEFMRLSDELQNGKGFATQSFQAFKEAGDDMDKLVQAAAMLVRDLQQAGDQMGDMRLKALATQTAVQLWGEGGRKLAEALEAGKISIADVQTKAAELGNVFSDRVVAAQKEMNGLLAEANARLSREMHPAMETLVGLGFHFQNIWLQIVKYSGDVVANINAAVGAQGRLANFGGISGLGNYQDKDLEAALKDKAAQLRAGVATAPQFAGHPAPPARPSLSSLENQKSVHEPKGSSPTESADEVERFIKSLEKQNAALAGEARAIGKSNIEREKSIDLAKAEEAALERKKPLTEKERSDVLALAEAHATLKQKIDDAAKAKQNEQAAQQFYGDQAFNIVDGLISQHKKLKDVLGDVAKAFEQAALKSLLMGQGPLAGLFGMSGKDGNMGGLFGGLFGLFSSKAEGGVAGSGPFSLAPIAAFANAPRFADGGGIPSILHPGEIVLNAAQQKNAAAAMGGGVTVHNYAGVNIEPRVTRSGVELIVTEYMAKGFRSYDKGLMSNIGDKQSRQF